MAFYDLVALAMHSAHHIMNVLSQLVSCVLVGFYSNLFHPLLNFLLPKLVFLVNAGTLWPFLELLVRLHSFVAVPVDLRDQEFKDEATSLFTIEARLGVGHQDFE